MFLNCLALQVSPGVVGQNIANAVNHVEEGKESELDKGLVQHVQLLVNVNHKIATPHAHQDQVDHKVNIMC